MLVFFVVIIIVCILFFCLSIGFKIENFKITNFEEKKQDAKVYLLIYIFHIKILSINIKLEDIKDIYDKERTKFNKSNILKNYKEIKHFLDSIEIKKILLNIDIGVDNAILTAYIIVILSTILSSIYSIYVKGNKKESCYDIKAIYCNGIKYKITLSCIIAVKTVHIIHIIYLILKKRRDEKYVRTSNRESYEGSYE